MTDDHTHVQEFFTARAADWDSRFLYRTLREVGQLPVRGYVRFDRNHYSIPHTHVRRPVTLLASPTTVRVLAGTEEIARHARSYDTGQVVEDGAALRVVVSEDGRTGVLADQVGRQTLRAFLFSFIRERVRTRWMAESIPALRIAAAGTHRPSARNRPTSRSPRVVG